MEKYQGYRCSLCQTEYSITNDLYTCPKCGGNLDVVMDISGIKRKYEIEDITCRREKSIWRYLPLLPIIDPGFEGTALRSVGWTPVYKPEMLAEKLGLRTLYLKDEGRNPTASFKDRASALVVAKSLEIGAKKIITASTGNAGAALAGMAAAIGQKAAIFAPKNAPEAKIAQLLIYGAKVVLVDGNYDLAFEYSLRATEEFGFYNRNTGFNPFTVEGKKTAAFEIWEQLLLDRTGSDKPLSIFVSVGDGNIISGIHKGFKDLQALGWLTQMPRIFGVQAEGSSVIAKAFFADTEDLKLEYAHTVADSISVDMPKDGVRAIRAAKETNGSYIVVSDQEIINAIDVLGKAGIFAEPAGAASYAGLEKAVQKGIIGSDDPVLVINTGSGLKDIHAALKAVKKMPVVQKDFNKVKHLILEEGDEVDI